MLYEMVLFIWVRTCRFREDTAFRAKEEFLVKIFRSFITFEKRFSVFWNFLRGTKWGICSFVKQIFASFCKTAFVKILFKDFFLLNFFWKKLFFLWNFLCTLNNKAQKLSFFEHFKLRGGYRGLRSHEVRHSREKRYFRVLLFMVAPNRAFLLDEAVFKLIITSVSLIKTESLINPHNGIFGLHDPDLCCTRFLFMYMFLYA